MLLGCQKSCQTTFCASHLISPSSATNVMLDFWARGGLIHAMFPNLPARDTYHRKVVIHRLDKGSREA